MRRFGIVRVDVATGWTGPDAPRDIDAAAIADVPDCRAWLTTLDERGPQGRLDLHNRTLTQLSAGEPVNLVGDHGDWLEVVARWQPSSLHADGYPVWIRRAHVDLLEESAAIEAPTPEIEPDPGAVIEAARRHLGLPYLWGGTSPYGLDCSGLVHLTFRRAGVIVPRDAHDQHAAATPVDLGDEQPGDLYFFARPDGYVFHVGFVTAPGRMLHAPETGRYIEDAPLAPSRRDTLTAVGRFRTTPGPATSADRTPPG